MPYQKIAAISEKVLKKRNRIGTHKFTGSFWKSCPGTGNGYLCCGYQIITPFVGCGMYCSYCILQEYFKSSEYKIYENFYDLEKEIHTKLTRWKGVVRIGTGEFADSLYLEHIHGLSQKLVSILNPYPNVVIELKTKSNRTHQLKSIQNPSKVVIGFSMNTERIITEHEKDTASLMERLEAAQECEKMGFWIAFHFDPIIWYPEWREDYKQVIDVIFSKIHYPHRIAWWSLGGFRTMPALKKRLRDYNRHIPLFAGEMVLGADKKYRYFRPIRVDFYRTIRKYIERYYPEAPLYLCMESPEIWKESGFFTRIPNGLSRYLDTRAKTMLGL